MNNFKSSNPVKIDEAYLDDLVLKAQASDKDAFAKIYDLLINKVYRYIYFKVDEAEVDDLVTITFTKVWANLKKYKKTDVSFQAWFFRIARNLVSDHHRFHRSLSEIDKNMKDERRESDPREFAELSINSSVLKSALSELKDIYQQIIIMKFINDLPNSEIASVLKKQESSIRVLQFRALANLRKILEKRGIKNEETF